MTLSRRRFLTIASAACLAAAAGGRAAASASYRWQGVALGAGAQILLDHPQAERIARDAVAEIARLEQVFSLHRPGSELSRLNREGRLAAPSFDLLDCLALAGRVHWLSEGRFDPTVQPLWAALAEAGARGEDPDPARIAAARAALGFERVRFDASAVVLSPGQALTLNGIAQGWIADAVADRMRAAGVSDVLVDAGEIVALGHAPDGEGWPVRIKGEAEARRLSGRALATSASLGTVLRDAAADDDRLGHILDPRGEMRPTRGPTARTVSVSAPRAALADALSTALCLAEDRSQAETLCDAAAGAWLEAFA